MKVTLAVCNTKQYLGINKYFYFLAKHLTEQRVNIEFIVDSQEGLRHLTEVFGHGSNETHFYLDSHWGNISAKVIKPSTGGLLNISNTALWCWNLSRYLKTRNFDILHTPHINPFFYLMQKNHKPVVFQPFGNELFSLEETAKGLGKLYYKVAQPVLRYCGHNCDALAVEGQFQWDEMVKWYDNEKAMFILPVGIDIDHIQQLASKYIKQESEYKTILAVNSFYPYEGMDTLIEAFKRIKQFMSNTRLVMVGAGSEENKIHKLIEQYNLSNSVFHFKNISEQQLYSFYKTADIFVSTSMEKDFLMSILEAEAFGLPIVSTGQEWLIDGNGYVVSREPRTIADAVCKVLKRPREGMSQRSREIVAQYDFKEIARVAMEKYKELLA